MVNKQGWGRCDNDKVRNEIAANGAAGNVNAGLTKLLLHRPRALFLYFRSHLPVHAVGRNRCTEQGKRSTDIGKIEIDLRHKWVDQHRFPVGARKKGSNNIGDKGRAHHNEDFLQQVKIAEDRDIPQEKSGRNDKPDPGDAGKQFKAAANRDQIARNQPDVGDNQDKRSEHSHPAAIICPQDSIQSHLSCTTNFRAGI